MERELNRRKERGEGEGHGESSLSLLWFSAMIGENDQLKKIKGSQAGNDMQKTVVAREWFHIGESCGLLAALGCVLLSSSALPYLG